MTEKKKEIFYSDLSDKFSVHKRLITDSNALFAWVISNIQNASFPNESSTNESTNESSIIIECIKI